ncbi:MAG: hypothetical protein Q7S37_01710 [bacterium]|nr:hypothetical protein [bacterium]
MQDVLAPHNLETGGVPTQQVEGENLIKPEGNFSSTLQKEQTTEQEVSPEVNKVEERTAEVAGQPIVPPELTLGSQIASQGVDSSENKPNQPSFSYSGTKDFISKHYKEPDKKMAVGPLSVLHTEVQRIRIAYILASKKEKV